MPQENLCAGRDSNPETQNCKWWVHMTRLGVQ